MSDVRDHFKRTADGERIRPPADDDEGPVAGIRGVFGSDAAFILREHAARKYEDRQFYGPGAADAEARRGDRTTAPKEETTDVRADPKPDPAPIVEKKRPRLFERMRRRPTVDLEAEAKRLRDEIAKLEGKK